jgi:hypothetical protein
MLAQALWGAGGRGFGGDQSERPELEVEPGPGEDLAIAEPERGTDEIGRHFGGAVAARVLAHAGLRQHVDRGAVRIGHIVIP